MSRAKVSWLRTVARRRRELASKHGASRTAGLGAGPADGLRGLLSSGACALPLLLLSCFGLHAQETNPFANDPKAVTVGESQFRANCAFCHGLGARGGGRGPDLTRAQKRHGKTDGDLFRTINDGIPGTAMPQNGTTSQGVVMTTEEIWQVIAYIRCV